MNASADRARRLIRDQREMTGGPELHLLGVRCRHCPHPLKAHGPIERADSLAPCHDVGCVCSDYAGGDEILGRCGDPLCGCALVVTDG